MAYRKVLPLIFVVSAFLSFKIIEAALTCANGPNGESAVAIINQYTGRLDCITGSGTASSAKTINQVAHGFTAGKIVRLNGSSYVLAQADNSTDAEVAGIVSSTAGADAFNLTTNGYVSGLSGFTAGFIYFLSTSTAGGLTTVETNIIGTVSKPVFLADSSSSGYFYNYRGQIISTQTASSLPAGSTQYIDNVFAGGPPQPNSAANISSITVNGTSYLNSGNLQASTIGNNQFLIGYTPVGSNYTEYASCDVNISTCVRLFMYPSNPGAFAEFNSSVTVDKDLIVTGNTTTSSETVTNNLTAASLSASTGAIAGALINTSTINAVQVNFTSGTYTAQASADQYGLLISTTLTVGCSGYGPLVQTNAGVTAPLLVCGSTGANNAFGFQMYNASTGTSANIQFILADTQKLHYLGFQEPSINATGTLFGVTKNVGDFMFTNALAGAVARTFVIGSVGNEDVIIGANNAQVLKVNKTGTLTLKAGGTGSLSGGIQMVTGTLQTTPSTGLFEMVSDNLYWDRTTIPQRQYIIRSSTPGLTSTQIPIATGADTIVSTPTFKYNESSTDVGLILTPIPTPVPASTPNYTDGSIHHDSIRHQLMAWMGGGASTSDLWDIISGTIFVSTTVTTISNTVSESSFSLVGIGTATIPSNWFAPGKTLKITAWGFYTTTGTPTLEIKINGTQTGAAPAIADTTALAMPTQVISSSSFKLDSMITCYVGGGGLRFWEQGKVEISSGTSNFASFPLLSKVQNSNFDGTVALPLNITATWGTANVANSLTITNLTFDRSD